MKRSIEIYNQERPHFSLHLQILKQTHKEETFGGGVINVITVIFVGQSSRLTRTEKGSPLCSDRMSELPYDKP